MPRIMPANKPIEELYKDILEIIGRHVDLSKHKVFIFGSRAGSESRKTSDIDIGIDGPKHIPRKALSDIKEEVEALPVLYKVDIVDFSRVSSEFKEVALKDIMVL